MNKLSQLHKQIRPFTSRAKETGVNKFSDVGNQTRPEDSSSGKKQVAWPLFERLSTKDKIFFAKRMSILLKAGVPILTALDMLKKQARTKTAARIYQTMASDVEQGQFLSASMAKYRKVFGEFAINIIQVGEVSGTLHDSLEYLAEEMKKALTLKRKIVSALVYPIFIMVATFGVTGLLIVYVFPKILPIFKSFRFDLPWSTRTLIWISDLVTNHFIALFLGFILLVVSAIMAMRVPAIRLRVQQGILKIPVLGEMLQSYHIANFCRTLGILLRSEVRIVEATTIVANTTENLVYKNQFKEMTQRITMGEKISQHLDSNSKYFPVVLSQMVLVGETAGNLSGSLMYLADMYEEEVDNQTKNLSTMIEPALMIVMGLVVGFIAMSIITPIYGVTQNLTPH